jgi:hypothetical protein
MVEAGGEKGGRLGMGDPQERGGGVEMELAGDDQFARCLEGEARGEERCVGVGESEGLVVEMEEGKERKVRLDGA